MAAFTTIDNPELYFQAKVYSGSSSDVTVTFDGDENMQPDLVWLQKTSGSGDPLIYDSIRGINMRLQTSGTDAEVDRSSNNDELKAFNTDGWTLGTFNSNVTGSGSTCISWNWKAGTAWSNDASATSVGSLDSNGSKNTTSKFSIIKYASSRTPSSVQTIAHDLGSTPEILIFKNTAESQNWLVWTKDLDNDNHLNLNTYGPESTDSGSLNNTAPASTIFTVNGDGRVNSTTDGHVIICYAWDSVQGFSKIGNYIGNENTDGVFVYTGFRPAYLLFKKVTGSNANWQCWDSKRDPHNPMNKAAHVDADSVSTDQNIDFLSNGFKCRQAYDDFNASGSTQIYMAFAESPFVNSKGVPNNAR